MTSCFSWRLPVLPGAVLALAVALASGSPAAAVCVGDCNGDNRVSIAEVQACVNLAAGLSTPPCAAADQNGDGTVEANEVDACVLGFLNAATCPMVAPTPTMAVATATNTPAVPTATHTPPPVATATNTAPPATATHTPGVPTPTFTATPGMEIGSHECQMVTGGGSKLAITTQALPLSVNPSGSLQIDCGSQGPDGTAPCTCSVNSFAPVVIPAIGDVCVNPFAGCPTGTIDCDGGTPQNVDVKGDHNIGSCTTQAGCATACDAHCATFGANYEAIASSCEGFCQGGSKENTACTNDTDCTGGTCVGTNPPAHPGLCNCVCSGANLGAAAPAGSLGCNVGVQINVELPSNGACGQPATIVLPPQCGAVTTAQAAGSIAKGNNSSAVTISAFAPPANATSTGNPISCASLAGGTLTGLKLVGSLGFFDSTLGDIHSGNAFVCQ